MCSLCRLPVAKNHNFGQILTCGDSCTDPFYRLGLNLVFYSRPTAYAYVPNFVSVGLFCQTLLAKNRFFCIFWTSSFSGVTNSQQSQKVGHGCTTTNLPLSNGIKIVSVLQRLHGESGRTISDVQKRHGQTDKQTDKQTKNSTFLATPAAGEIRAPPNLAW